MHLRSFLESPFLKIFITNRDFGYLNLFATCESLHAFSVKLFFLNYFPHLKITGSIPQHVDLIEFFTKLHIRISLVYT